MTILGTPKPAYRAFELLHGAGESRFPVSGVCPCGGVGGNEDGGISAICGCAAAPDITRPMATEGVAASTQVGTEAKKLVARCVDGRNSTSSGVLATSNGTALRLFLYNHPLFSGTNGSDCAITVTLSSGSSSISGSAGHPDDGKHSRQAHVDMKTAVMTRIDEQHSNPKAVRGKDTLSHTMDRPHARAQLKEQIKSSRYSSSPKSVGSCLAGLPRNG